MKYDIVITEYKTYSSSGELLAKGVIFQPIKKCPKCKGKVYFKDGKVCFYCHKQGYVERGKE
jgi:hypothetical protein